ncbi:MAG: 1-acyl-sn-glycerol-3-phosphate acyltransferase [Bacilli bacterium]|jgi:1-acyl-sn-glycerol-3-phosphate acyltransferase|nr:1-acyl-sn-glycerol-3-phosphate acyltransferase [Bacilli bacterium]
MDYKKEALLRRQIANFTPFNEDERKIYLKKMEKNQLKDYYEKERWYNYVHGIPPFDIEQRQKDYALINTALKINRTFSNHPFCKIIGDKRKKTNRPVIYAVTHVGLYDYQMITEAIGDQTFALAGDPEIMYGTFDGFFMEKSGVIYCDTNNALDRYVAEKTAIKYLVHGANILLYPEGVWNLTPNLLVLPLWPGVIRIAQQANADIVPVAIEQYGHSFIINYGPNFEITNHDINDLEYIDLCRNILRDNLATLKYEIFLSKRCIKRSKIGEYEEYLKKFENTRLNEWKDKDKNPIYTLDLVKSRTYRESDKNVSDLVGEKVLYASPIEAFNFIKNLSVSKNNAFLLRRDFSMPKSIEMDKEEKVGEIIYTNSKQKEKVLKIS